MKRKNIFKLIALCISAICITSCGPSNEPSEEYDPYKPYPISSEEASISREKLLHFENPNKSKHSPAISDGSFTNTKTNEMLTHYNDYMDQHLFGLDACPSVGDVNFLVIPCNLKGGLTKKEDLDHTRKDIYDAYFGNPADTMYESVQSFFYESSYGNLSISGYVTDWFNAENYDYLISDFKEHEHDKTTEELLNDATRWAKTVYTNIDWKDFDSDNDGYLDAVVLIYDLYNYTNQYYRRHGLKQNSNLWAYCTWHGENIPNKELPTPKSYFWASYDFMYTHNTSVIKKPDCHTYIHETGHLMGLEDYYDYEDSYGYGPTGGAIMECHNVGDHDPFSKLALGWINPLVVTGDCKVNLKPFATSGNALVLSYKNMYGNREFDSPFDEYFILDFYTPTGLHEYDSFHQYGTRLEKYPILPKEIGVRIWHVDARIAEMHEGKKPNTYWYNIVNHVDRTKPDQKYLNLTSNSTYNPDDLANYGCFDIKNKDYNLLELIQRGNHNTFTDGSNMYFTSQDMFKEGDSFSTLKYAGLLPMKNGLMNDVDGNGHHLSMPFTVTINEMNNDGVSISVKVN